RAGGLAALRATPRTPGAGGAGRATPRPRVPLGTPALSLPPDRRNYQASLHSLLVPATVALRHPPRSRLFPSRQRALRPAPRRGSRYRPWQAARGRELVAATFGRGEAICRARTPRRATPLDHCPRAAG